MMRYAVAAVGLVLVALLASHSSPVRAEPVASIDLPPPRASVDLYPGCNNIGLTFADGTASEKVVQAVTPAGMVESMWRHDAASERFEGFNPDFPEASDLRAVNLWDAVWICVGEAAVAAPTPTPSPGRADPVLVGAGDIASCSSTGDQATADLLDTIPGTVFTTGDNVYDSGTASEFANCYDPSWGRHKARTRPSAGNHDYETPGASDYFSYFGEAAGDPSKGYYSYDLGAWHVVVINSNCSQVGGCGAGSPQEQWLRADLAANPTACTVAYWHHPRFSSGTKHGSASFMQTIWQALYDYGADLVLSGHEHDYERFAPQNPSGEADPARGIREFVVGTGGKSHYGFATPLATSEVRNGDTYGVLRLTLHATSYEWQFVPVAGGTFTDSGSASCVSTDTKRVTQEPIDLLENVTMSTAYRYGVRDDSNNTMDTLKIIENPEGGYLGVYHTAVGSVFYAKVATSADLLNWRFAADLDSHAAQPTIARLSDGGYLVAYEKDSGGVEACSGHAGGSGNCLRFRYYPDLTALLTASYRYQFTAARTLSNCAEGTPNIYSALLSPDILHSAIAVGFHYFRDCDVDRQARGVLTNFGSWTAWPETSRNSLFEALTGPPIGGNVGDRDHIIYKTNQYDLHEAQLARGDWSSWRAYLYDYEQDRLVALNIKTHGGSTSFGNPTFTAITSPNGRRAVVVTYFLFWQGAASGEAGELIFYREY